MTEKPKTPRGNKILRAGLIMLGMLVLAGVGGGYYFYNWFFTAPENQLTVTGLGEPFDFEWGTHEANGRTIEYAFQFVPVSIEGIDQTLWMQFDVGSQVTKLYREQVRSLKEQGVEVPIVGDDGNQRVEDFSFRVGSTRVTAASLQVIPFGSGINWDNGDSRRIIGTLGADWIDGRVLLVNYPKAEVSLHKALPEGVDPAGLAPFSFAGRRFFLPASINGEAGEVWFDNGSSAFELIVAEETFRAMAKEGAEDRPYEGKSWGQPIRIHNIDADATMEFAGTTVPVREVSWIEYPDTWMAAMMGTFGFDGMCGNRLFLQHTLVLDAKDSRYGLLD